MTGHAADVESEVSTRGGESPHTSWRFTNGQAGAPELDKAKPGNTDQVRCRSPKSGSGESRKDLRAWLSAAYCLGRSAAAAKCHSIAKPEGDLEC